MPPNQTQTPAVVPTTEVPASKPPAPAEPAASINQHYVWYGPIFRIIWVCFIAAIVVFLVHHTALLAIEAVQFAVVCFFGFAFFEMMIYVSLLGTHTGRLRIKNSQLYYRQFDVYTNYGRRMDPINPVDLTHLTRAIWRKGRIATRSPVPRVGALMIYVPAAVVLTDSKGAMAEFPMWGWTGQRRLAALLLYCLQQSGAEVDDKATQLLQKRAKNYNGPLAVSSDDDSGYFYISDKVLEHPRRSLFKARVVEVVFSLIFSAAALLVFTALVPAAYKHYNGVIALAYVASGAAVSFVIFFNLIGRYTHKLAGQAQPRSKYAWITPSSFIFFVITVQIGMSVGHATDSVVSNDMSLYVAGGVGAFTIVLALAFMSIAHATVDKVHGQQRPTPPVKPAPQEQTVPPENLQQPTPPAPQV